MIANLQFWYQYCIILHFILRCLIGTYRAGARAVDLLRGAKRLSGGSQSLKLSTKAAVFKRESCLNGGAKHVDYGGQALPWRRAWKLIYCIIIGVPRDFNQNAKQCSGLLACCCLRVTSLSQGWLWLEYFEAE